MKLQILKRIGLMLLLAPLWYTSISAQKLEAPTREQAFDQPEDEDDLNRELWEFAKKTPYTDALSYVARTQAAARGRQRAEVELPNGWRIAPAGTQVEVGRLPYEAVPFAGSLVILNTGYYNREPQEISVVDTRTNRVTKTLRPGALFPSAQVGDDGDLYVSGGFDGKVYRYDKSFNLVRAYTLPNAYAGVLASVDATHIAVTYLTTLDAEGNYGTGKVVLLNTQTGNIERETNVGNFPYAIQRIEGKLYVAMLGDDKLLVLDSDLGLRKSIATGRTPIDLCADEDSRLYIVNSNSDDITVIDARADRLAATIKLPQHQGVRFGNAPTSCAVDDKNLYVALAGSNSVAVIDKRTQKQTALVPTGWYPTKVVADGNQLFILSAKGIRARRPNPQGPQPFADRGGTQYILTLLGGALAIVPQTQLAANRRAWTTQVMNGAPLYDARRVFQSAPIRHVFYIIKENRTYDQILGDLGRGNGDTSLTLFGRDITPNHHRLAEEFVALDNFYADGETSVLGHSFTTSGYASPFLEWLGNAAYSGRYRGYPFGTVPAVFSPSYLWDALDDKQISYRIYGEPYYLFTRTHRIIVEEFGADSALAKKFYARTMSLAAKTDRGKAFYDLAKSFNGQADTRVAALRLLANEEFTKAASQLLSGDDEFANALRTDAEFRTKFADMITHYALNYSPWDLSVSDLDRAQKWQADFARQLAQGDVAKLHYIWLPNDHTAGTDTRLLNPFQFVAQNDAALGRVVETISHSPVWRDSVIFVEEDDAQNGADHVDATRTVALVASPYAKRGAVVSDRYDQLSVLRTIDLIFELNSLNLNQRVAVPMFGVFTERPDFRPYNPPPASTSLTEADRTLERNFKTR